MTDWADWAVTLLDIGLLTGIAACAYWQGKIAGRLENEEKWSERGFRVNLEIVRQTARHEQRETENDENPDNRSKRHG